MLSCSRRAVPGSRATDGGLLKHSLLLRARRDGAGEEWLYRDEMRLREYIELQEIRSRTGKEYMETRNGPSYSPHPEHCLAQIPGLKRDWAPFRQPGQLMMRPIEPLGAVRDNPCSVSPTQRPACPEAESCQGGRERARRPEEGESSSY